MKVWRSAQVKLFPTKNCPPRLASFIFGEEQFDPSVDEVLDDINDLVYLCCLHACVASETNLTSNKSCTGH